MKRILLIAFALVFALPAVSRAATEKAEKEWTFLLFLNGNNNLDSFGALNINQMEKVGSSDKVNMVVQWASLANGGVKRLLVQQDADARRVTSPIVQEMGKVDMGDVRVFEEFVKWGVTNYPAKHYFVAVWDHGSGWRYRARAAAGVPHIADISWDDLTGHSITTKQLGASMNNLGKWLGRKIDMYGSDACLMAMVEVAAEMKDSVAFFVGSQDLEPGEGWPYTETFAGLVANPMMSPRDFSAHMVEEYAKSYNGGSNGRSDVTLSSFDLAKYPQLKDSIRKLSTEFSRMPAPGKTKIFAAAKAAQAFDYSDYVDLGDFLKRVGAENLRDLDAQVVLEANNAVKDFVVLSRNTGRFAPSTGASIWIPKDTGTLNRYLASYKALAFDGDTQWADALKDFVGK